MDAGTPGRGDTARTPAPGQSLKPEKPAKQRADRLVVEQGLAPSREKAQALILAGLVCSDGRRVEKAGHLLVAGTRLELTGRACPYVSRGGLKLEAALDGLGLSVEGLVCADVGASTGGFTDCLLKRGAARIYAVDVGHGQLDVTLRTDPRVVAREGVNARYLDERFFPEPVSLVVVDASFISLRLLLPAIRKAAPGARIVALVKPQFEAGRREVGRGGVVRDGEVRARAVRTVCEAALELGYTLRGTLESPITGPKGNVETFVYLVPGGREAAW
jgi:23S rRNA (cytidine1920-2'-O)/16S rRNA (cytidine1409-2'-O)-methyltransferase